MWFSSQPGVTTVAHLPSASIIRASWKKSSSDTSRSRVNTHIGRRIYICATTLSQTTSPLAAHTAKRHLILQRDPLAGPRPGHIQLLMWHVKHF